MILLNNNKIEFTKFPNGETNVPSRQIRDLLSIRTNKVTLKYEDDTDLIKLLFLKRYLDTLQEPSRLTIAYMPYSRTDRVEDDSVFTLKYIADFINSLDFKGVVTIVEPHSDVTSALINGAKEVCPSIDIFEAVKNLIGFDIEKDYVYFSDTSAHKRYIKKIGNHKVLVGFKHRNFKTREIISLEILGKLEGSPKIICLDDIISSGETLLLGTEKLNKMGASEIYVVTGHCENHIYNGDIFKTDYIKKIFTTDSILTNMEQTGADGKLDVYKL